MLIFVIITIAAFKWKLNIGMSWLWRVARNTTMVVVPICHAFLFSFPGMAFVMFFLYFVFVVLSVMLEKQTIKCETILSIF